MPRDNRKNYILLILGGIIIIALFLVWWLWPVESSQNEQRQFQTIQLGENTFEVVLSTTPAQLQQGLSDRKNIGADGMLFVLPVKSRPAFWMLRMHFNLDFVWIAEGQVVDVHHNVSAPPSGVAQQDIAQVQPRADSEYVLEVPAGFIDRFGITMGTPFGFVGEPVDKPWNE